MSVSGILKKEFLSIEMSFVSCLSCYFTQFDNWMVYRYAKMNKEKISILPFHKKEEVEGKKKTC